MATQVKLAAKPRSESGRNAVKQVRSRDAVPAVIYGGHGAPQNLEVDRKEIGRLLAAASSEHVLVELEIDEGGKPVNRLSLIQDVQHHPVRGDILHVDFQAVSRTETVVSEVPVEPEGEPVGVKNFGGILQQQIRMLEVECLPQNLPDVVRIDVSGMMVGGSLHIRDIALPEGVKATADPEITVFIVSEPNVAAEAPSTTPEAPEVLREKKPDADQAEK